MNFFVVGLPRSRTAWLANFLTYDNRLCFHEGLNGCQSLEKYREKLGANKGDSSTGLMLIDINALYPDAPVLVIESDGKKTAEFIYKEYGFYAPEAVDFFKSKLRKIKGKRIHVNDIDNRLEEIWAYLIGTPFNRQRADLLTGFNVQMKNTSVITKMGSDLWTAKMTE